jgi:hypothetical protein
MLSVKFQILLKGLKNKRYFRTCNMFLHYSRIFVHTISWLAASRIGVELVFSGVDVGVLISWSGGM